MDIPHVLLGSAAGIAVAVASLWLLSLLLSDASIVDIFWGLGFVLTAWLCLLLGGSFSWRSLLPAVLTTLWGLRLSGYLAWRNWGEPEDYRYRKMRDKHGKWFPLVSLVTVFLLQGGLMWIVSLPVQLGVAAPGPWHWGVAAGVVLWLTGLVFEAVGDWQLARFKAKPENEGEVMDRGLWRYTRHPNYFGDFLVWWGLYLTSARPDSWWWTAAGPLVMSILLVRFSGVRLLESSIRERRPAYEDYARRTSTFFPLPPRN